METPLNQFANLVLLLTSVENSLSLVDLLTLVDRGSTWARWMTQRTASLSMQDLVDISPLNLAAHHALPLVQLPDLYHEGPLENMFNYRRKLDGQMTWNIRSDQEGVLDQVTSMGEMILVS